MKFVKVKKILYIMQNGSEMNYIAYDYVNDDDLLVVNDPPQEIIEWNDYITNREKELK